jgi:hypothetical protein
MCSPERFHHSESLGVNGFDWRTRSLNSRLNMTCVDNRAAAR